jgi:hypothetical protein
MKMFIRILVDILTLGLAEIARKQGYDKGIQDQKAAFEKQLEEKRKLDDKIVKEQT